MRRIKRWLFGMTAGVALSVLLAEALLALGELWTGQAALLASLAAGQTLGAPALTGLLFIWLLAALAGGALGTALARSSAAGLAAGFLPGLALAFNTVVGAQSDSLALMLGLAPVLGSLLGIRFAQQLISRDQAGADNAASSTAGL